MNKILLMFFVLFTLTAYCSTLNAGGWKQKEFIITMWCPPPSNDENLARLVREGFTLTNVSFSGDDRVPDSEAAKMLSIVDKYNIKTLIGNDASTILRAESLDDPAQKAKLDEFIEMAKKHPSFAGYFLADEPSATTFANWGRIAKYLKERDPDHLVFINLFPTYASQEQLGVFLKEPVKGKLIPDNNFNFAGIGTDEKTAIFYNEHLKQYMAQLKPELLSYDHYSFMEGGNDGLQYFLNLELMRGASLSAKLPFINFVQACTIVKSWRMPNKDELRWLAYTTMVYGGRGIGWFLYAGPSEYGGLYQNGKRMPAADWVAEINQEIKSLGLELMKLNSNQIYHSEPLPIGTRAMAGSPVNASGGQYVIGMFEENGSTNAFMIMNRDYKTKSVARMSINLGDGKLFEFSIPDGKWTEIKAVTSGSVIDVELPPGGGKLFKIMR